MRFALVGVLAGLLAFGSARIEHTHHVEDHADPNVDVVVGKKLSYAQMFIKEKENIKKVKKFRKVNILKLKLKLLMKVENLNLMFKLLEKELAEAHAVKLNKKKFNRAAADVDVVVPIAQGELLNHNQLVISARLNKKKLNLFNVDHHALQVVLKEENKTLENKLDNGIQGKANPLDKKNGKEKVDNNNNHKDIVQSELNTTLKPKELNNVKEKVDIKVINKDGDKNNLEVAKDKNNNIVDIIMAINMATVTVMVITKATTMDITDTMETEDTTNTGMVEEIKNFDCVNHFYK